MTDELGFAAAEAMGLVEVGPAPKKSPEQRVREAWERVSWGAIGTPADDYEGVRITCESRTKIFDSWQAAREFTEQRLEEIRCLEREIEAIKWCASTYLPLLFPVGSGVAYWQGAGLPRDLATISRAITRLTAARDELKQGMK